MSSHTNHADVHEHGLFDGCPRCLDLSAFPIRDLDAAMLAKLVEMATRRDWKPRSAAELQAVNTVRTTLERAARLCDAAPAEVETFLRERHRLIVAIRPGRPG